MGRVQKAYSTASVAPSLKRIWTSMRVMRRFTTADLATTAEANASTVEKFVRRLKQAGFLRLLKARESGRPGSRDLFALVRDSGPLPPIWRWDNTGVYDPNTGTVWPIPPKAATAAPEAATEGGHA